MKELKGVDLVMMEPRTPAEPCQWNPVKELKVYHRAECQLRRERPWNPVKELKVPDIGNAANRPTVRKWNPVKELKVLGAKWLFWHIFVESGEGIERSPCSA